MLLHRKPGVGLLRCRCKQGRCPYGGPVAQTVTRFRGTPEERAAKHAERKKKLQEDPAALIPKHKLASTGVGKHIREESKTEELQLIKQAKAYLEGRTVASIPTSTIEPNIGKPTFLPPTKEKSKLSQQNGENVRSIMRDKATGEISDMMNALQKNQKTRGYFRGGGFETEGTSVGDKIFNKGEVWEDVQLENNFKTRVYTDGRVSVEVPTEEGTSWMPVGKINAGEFASGQYLVKVDKAMTKLKSRKTPFKNKEDIQKALKSSFASARKGRQPKVTKTPEYAPQTPTAQKLTNIAKQHKNDSVAYFDAAEEDETLYDHIDEDEYGNRVMSTYNSVLDKKYGGSKVALITPDSPQHITMVTYSETGELSMGVNTGNVDEIYPIEASFGKVSPTRFASGEATSIINKEVKRYEEMTGKTQFDEVDVAAIAKSVQAKLK